MIIQLTRLFKFRNNRILNLHGHFVVDNELFDLTTKEELFSET